MLPELGRNRVQYCGHLEWRFNNRTSYFRLSLLEKNPPQWIDKNKHYKIEELGLFDDKKETTNELVDFYNYYLNLMGTVTIDNERLCCD